MVFQARGRSRRSYVEVVLLLLRLMAAGVTEAIIQKRSEATAHSHEQEQVINRQAGHSFARTRLIPRCAFFFQADPDESDFFSV